MTLYAINEGSLIHQKPSSFEELRFRERGDLQRLLRAHPDALGEDLIVIAEEFGNWDESRRRIDLLALDRAGRLVVIELKRDGDGSHMELQALRYAAMVATMTFDQVVATYAQTRNRAADETVIDAREELLGFLELEDEVEDFEIVSDVRIILAASGFNREITTTVMWLNKFENMDIRCVKIVPYNINNEIYLDIQQLIPLPEAGDYQVRVREKEAAQRRSGVRVDNRDWTQYQVIVDGNKSEPLRKRQAVREMIKALAQKGITYSKISEQLPGYGLLSVPGRLTDENAVAAALTEIHQKSDTGRWFTEDPLVEGDQTWVVYRMWALRDTQPALESLREAFPDSGVNFCIVE